MRKRVTVFIAIYLIYQVFLTTFAQVHAAISADHTVIRGENGILYVSTELNKTEVHQASAVTGSTQNSASESASLEANDPDHNEIIKNATESRNISTVTMPNGFFTNFTTLFNGLLRIAFLISALLAFFYLLRSGFIWITSGGDRGKLESARNGIIAAVLGLIIVSASYAVLTLVIEFLGFDSLQQVFENGLMRR